MPTAFTPNRDYRNETFRIPPDASFTLKDFSIYNRWGGIVFRTKDINIGWDGTQRGIAANAGLYVYTISGIDQNKEVVVRGTVFLVR